ncbi:hypothetical protein CHS0354_015921 [Potamilus streckersoni]|uniref:Intimal thickness related receptor IRP domain-containing protein n=1 Tax=Potamilus streckersoni TaxID=2493646 RepID=A0AAE0SRI8_9BIVA|nr:hypothetical protein CHS0354_015921 [Potamilus streckersoni]
MDSLSLIFLCLALISFVYFGNGKYITGTLKTSNDWEFLTRFCFLSEKGAMQFTFEYPTHYGPQNVLLYFDGPGQWQSVYRSSKTCKEKEAVLNPQNNQIIYLTEIYGLSGCAIKVVDGVSHYSCTGGRTFRSSRERWWFVAVSKCVTPVNNTAGMYLKYEVSMTNGPEGDYLHREYSADEFFLLRARQLWHSTYKLFMTSLAFWIMYLFFMTLGYGIYGNDGNYDKLKRLKTTGRVFEAVSVVSFLLMLILMGKGYTITRGRLSTSGTIKLSVFFCLYIVAYAVLIIWEPFFFDPGLVLYIYESPPGYGLICMRLIGWIWLCYSVFFTLKHYPEKKMFYIPFFVFYTFWFWAGPVVILIAMLAMAQWTREKTVVGVENLVALCGHMFFLILTRPSAANKNFPYHVRTTQIGIMVNAPHQMGTLLGTSAELNSFENHTYSVSTSPGVSERGPDFTGLFVTSKERSKFPQNEHEMSINNSKRRPEDETSQPPSYSSVQIMPSSPPRYEALFTVSDE